MTMPYMLGPLVSVDKIWKASIALYHSEQDFNFYVFTIKIAHYMESMSIILYVKLNSRGRKCACVCHALKRWEVNKWIKNEELK